MSGEEASIIAAAVALSLGGVLFAMLASAMARRAADVVSLIAGVALLLVAALHFAPEALRADNATIFFLLGGAGIGIALEILVRTQPGATKPGAVHAAARLALIVLAVHSMLDGAVYTAAFWHDHGTGLAASVGLVLHEAPEGIVAMMLALQTGLRPRNAALLAIAASSLTTPLGWALAHGVGDAAHGAMQLLFAGSAGLLLFAGWHLVSDGWRSLRRRARERS
jgi:zinc and cadmium transporter